MGIPNFCPTTTIHKSNLVGQKTKKFCYLEKQIETLHSVLIRIACDNVKIITKKKKSGENVAAKL